jgi:phosphoribosylformylglycinamidine cyclo-ligase
MTQNAYKDAGVDIEAGNTLVERIKPAVKGTFRTGSMSNIGGFGALFDLKATGYQDPILVSATDGVGTKIKIAIDMNKHDTIGQDLVAMCVNDLIVQGAEPLFFLDYFASGKLDVDTAQSVIEGIAHACTESGCALIGGETAEMPGLYAAGDYDLAGFTVGAVERSRMITGERIAEGDIVLALASSGLHSNGYSLVRKIVQSTQGHSYDSPCAFADGKTMGEVLLTPTRLYIKSLLAALKLNDANDQPAIKGMANITGGGLTENIPRVLPQGTMAVIDANAWDLPPMFRWLKEHGQLSDADLAVTLNCGIGMIVVCAADQAVSLTENLTASGESVYKIGHIEKTDAKPHIVMDNTDTAWKN